ncbi:hypothetical protein J2X20_004534 [Pelomonas saccharophila]|uniref:Uncharacterized protein n=1 Tax=Roseateles saccharophilus TaxID=304 RepID=A0ABU1YUK4_ROSSA|nr:hypothetical protein [Roseateles saccharophilus]MDR7271866.1 hypothetical protein [Roseateles saccharophilus]
MKLPALSRFLSPRTPNAPPAAWRLEGFDPTPTPHPWARTPLLLPRSRCRLRWFRLQGIPAPERLGALRLQVQAWRPFDHTAARLVVQGEQGLAIAWDEAVLHQDALAAGLPPERCQLLYESFSQAGGADGLRLLRNVEGYEAQQWQEGQLVASRWWPEALSESDWQEFVRACGASRDGVTVPMPEPQTPLAAVTPWARHFPLHPSADAERGPEQRLVLLGGLGLLLGVGVMAHQWWDAHSQERRLTQQVADLKASARPVLAARDATMAQMAEVEKLASWFAAPQPVDVLGYLNDTLARLNVQIKELELEGDKLRLALQLGPNTGRANVVKELQAGGWFTDVTEVRADNASNLLVMDMRIRGALPPVVAAAEPAAPLPTAGVAAAPAAATAPATAPAILPAPAPAPAAAPRAAVPTPPPKGPPQPTKPIVAKPDANGLPPSSVFDAIPNR